MSLQLFFKTIILDLSLYAPQKQKFWKILISQKNGHYRKKYRKHIIGDFISAFFRNYI